MNILVDLSGMLDKMVRDLLEEDGISYDFLHQNANIEGVKFYPIDVGHLSKDIVDNIASGDIDQVLKILSLVAKTIKDTISSEISGNKVMFAPCEEIMYANKEALTAYAFLVGDSRHHTLLCETNFK